MSQTIEEKNKALVLDAFDTLFNRTFADFGSLKIFCAVLLLG